MTTELNNRDHQFDPNSANGRDSFQEHHEQMKAFCRSHTNVTLGNTPGCGKPGILESTRALRLHRTVPETGGVRLINGLDDWSILVAALEVTRHKFWQN